MIKLIDNLSLEHQNEIVNFCEEDGLGVKAVGSLLSYGIKYDFALFWEQRSYDGILTAFISKVYGDITVYALADADVSEIKEFVSVIGYCSLTSDTRITEAGITGYIMKLDRGIECTAGPSERPHKFIFNDNLKAFFSEITHNNPSYISAAYEDWLVDISHRIRHDTAATLMAISATDKNVIYSTAAALTITPHCSLIGAISTREEYRGRHFAYSCLDNLCNKFFDKKIYLMCKPDKVEFYERAGLHNDGEFSIV